jgi:hypothetical protein
MQVTDLMHIYKGLQDPDALTGVTLLRSGGPSRADLILAAETFGRWNDAAVLYEVELDSWAAGLEESVFSGAAQVLKHAPWRALPEGYLHSFLAAGKPRLLLSVAEGHLAAAADERDRRRIAAAGVAAAWRLLDWHSVARFLTVRDPGRCLGVFVLWAKLESSQVSLCEDVEH